MGHLPLRRKKELSSFRRIAIGSWQTAYDPTVYGTLTLRMDEAVRYIEAFRQATGRRLTVTHLVTKAAAEALRRCPEANAIIRWNRIYLRERVTISVLVVQPDGGDGKVDLTAAKIEDADRKSLVEIVDELAATIETVRARKDVQLERGKSMIQRIPLLFMNAFLKLLAFLLYTLNLSPRWLGMPRDPFGGLTVTNVGSLGLDTAFVPLVPYTRVPIFVATGEVKAAPVVEDGRIVVGQVMNVNASFDHRFIDGYHASILAGTMREMIERPFESFDRLDGGGSGSGAGSGA
jgi:pyruvate/2-oxoglutarate dehydrogenase complex dihydrolipoamide acyltransferase (E2) component